jgi:hypothetical protein
MKVKKKETLNPLDVVLEQNYLQINDQYYMHYESLAMEAPTLAILAETYINFLYFKQILDYGLLLI